MKLFCQNCGIHFPHDFENTLQLPCNFWGAHNMGNAPVDLKKEIWDWAFAMPSDKFFIKTGMGMLFSFEAVAVEPETRFESAVPGWEKMTEEQKQDYQREYFKKKIRGEENPIILPKIEKKEITN